MRVQGNRFAWLARFFRFFHAFGTVSPGHAVAAAPGTGAGFAAWLLPCKTASAWLLPCKTVSARLLSVIALTGLPGVIVLSGILVLTTVVAVMHITIFVYISSVRRTSKVVFYRTGTIVLIILIRARAGFCVAKSLPRIAECSFFLKII